MKQQPYVTEQGQPYQPKSNKRMITIISIAILVVLIVIFIIIGSIRGSKNRKCTKLEELLETSARNYMEANELMPTINGTFVTINVNDLLASGYLKSVDYQIKSNACGGSVKFTKVDDDYIATLDLTNCDYCTTSTHYGDWSTETTKKPKNNIVDVTAYYNYVEKETYYTKWTSYYTLAEIEKYPITEVTDSRFPKIASDAKNIEIEVDTLMYYRHRDQRWKFYKDNGGNYSSFFSSEQPEGYANKDTNTVRQTEYTDWSLDYPEKKDYRTIKEDMGYRWYYMDGKTKVYWNSGAYYPEAPSEEYTEHDKESVKMYSYSDKEWRWYNGAKRKYSNFTSTMPSGYTYRDDELTSYGGWSSWTTTSQLDETNRSYREEETENRPRYRLKYDMYSFEKLSNSLTQEEFEQTTGMTLQQVIDAPNLDLIVTYKYKTRK